MDSAGTQGQGRLGSMDIAEAKVSKAAANFKESQGTSSEGCGSCRFFNEGSSSCDLVEGSIDAADTCDLFQPIETRESLGSTVSGLVSRVNLLLESDSLDAESKQRLLDMRNSVVEGWGQVSEGVNQISTGNGSGGTFRMTTTDSTSEKPELEEHASEGEFVPLVEKAVRPDGTIPIKVIQPGWGSSGYYSREVLERDGPKAFKRGTKMFWDHPTPTEANERPERSLRDLAAELITDAYFQEDGPDGPGLYADAKVFGQFKPHIEDLAPHMGVSIRAMGSARKGEAEGRKGPLIEKIHAAKSVDFVTAPGAGGKVLELFESARASDLSQEEDDGMELQEAQVRIGELESELAESNTAKDEAIQERDAALAESKRLSEALLVRQTADKVAEAIAEAKLPSVTKTRLIESISMDPPMTDEGALDEDALKTKITEAVKAEVLYLSEAVGGGRIQGAGGVGFGDGAPSTEDAEKRLASTFQRLGLAESTAKVAAGGRS